MFGYDTHQMVVNNQTGERYNTGVGYDPDYRTSGTACINGTVYEVRNDYIAPSTDYGYARSWSIIGIKETMDSNYPAYLRSLQLCVCPVCKQARAQYRTAPHVYIPNIRLKSPRQKAQVHAHKRKTHIKHTFTLHIDGVLTYCEEALLLSLGITWEDKKDGTQITLPLNAKRFEGTWIEDYNHREEPIGRHRKDVYQIKSVEIHHVQGSQSNGDPCDPEFIDYFFIDIPMTEMSIVNQNVLNHRKAWQEAFNRAGEERAYNATTCTSAESTSSHINEDEDFDDLDKHPF